ncbi:hypothetical protein [Sharpea azabuensis]|uniref:hypothetical protein n=1 Tax=Sharpea azabuensis TaxID=322505 RepID=UPI00156A4677|nr:hypothetical protein [Sharpea azabuensis]
MDEITLYIYDSQDYEIKRVVSYIGLNLEKHQLTIEYGYQSPNGLSDIHVESVSISSHFSLSELYDLMLSYWEDVSFDDLLYNDRLMDYFLCEKDEGHLSEIDELFQEMIDEDRDVYDEDDVILLAVDYSNYGQFLKARALYEKAEECYQNAADLLSEVVKENDDDINRHNVTSALEQLADILFIEEKDEEALKAYQDLFSQISACEEDYRYGHVLERIALIYHRLDDDSRSLFFHKAELVVYRKLWLEEKSDDNQYALAIGLRQIALRIMHLNMNKQEALDMFEESYQYLCGLPEHLVHDDLIVAIEYKGDASLVLEDYQQAIQYYCKVEEMIIEDDCKDQSIDNLFSKSIIHKKLGRCYEKLNDKNKAMSYFQEALEEVSQVAKNRGEYHDYSEKGIALMNIGWHYFNHENYDLAYQYFYDDLLLRIQINNRYHTIASAYSLSLAMRHMGYVEEALGHLESARDYLKECLLISQQYRKKDKESREYYYYVSLKDYAHILYVLEEYQEAYEDFKEVEEYLKSGKITYVHEYTLNFESIKEMQDCEEKCNGIY